MVGGVALLLPQERTVAARESPRRVDVFLADAGISRRVCIGVRKSGVANIVERLREASVSRHPPSSLGGGWARFHNLDLRYGFRFGRHVCREELIEFVVMVKKKKKSESEEEGERRWLARRQRFKSHSQLSRERPNQASTRYNAAV